MFTEHLASGYRPHFHDFKLAPFDFADGGEFVMNPAIIGCSADVPVTAVVGQNHAVSFESFKDDFGGTREFACVKAGFQSNAHPHGRKVFTFVWTGEVGGRWHISMAGFFDSEAQGVGEFLRAADFIIASQTGHDGQSSRIGTGPASGAWLQGFEIKDGAARGIPGFATIDRKGVEDFIELPVVLVEHKYMAVALALRASFDDGIRRDGIRAGIALVFAIVKDDGHPGLITADDVIGNTTGCAVPHGAKVFVQSFISTDAGDDGIAERIHRVFGDVAIPFIIERHQPCATEVSIRASFEPRLLCEGGRRKEEQCEDGFHEKSVLEMSVC